jgi:predicted phosphodiesterase
VKLLVLSDLHVEQAAFAPAPFEADVVVLAGDIHNGPQALRWARATFPRHPIVQVAGNHEFYDGEHGATLRSMRDAARECGVFFLENESVEVGRVRFLGCTLWTDFRVFEVPGRALSMPAERAMQANERLLADYRAIAVVEAGVQRRFAPADAARLHAGSRAWLECELARPFEGSTVVVTHHLPSWRSVHPDYAAWVSNAGFASDLDALVERSDLWIHGHTHATRRYRVGPAGVVCNPRGYPRAMLPAASGAAAPTARSVVFENPHFVPGLCVEVEIR